MSPPNYLAAAIELHGVGELSRAAELCRRVLESYPDNADAWHLLGILSHQQKDNDLALKLINIAIEIRPNIADFHNNLGRIYWDLGDEVSADLQYREALKLNPVHIKALNNLAGLLRATGQFSSAVDWARRAVSADPTNPEAFNNLGNALKDINLIDDAVSAYGRAIELEPDYALVHWNLSLALLALGKYRQGFKEMMWRWKWDGFPSTPREFVQPLLRSLSGLENRSNGTRILVYPEQGLGDTIHFIRYAALLKEIGVHVIFECPEELLPLVEGSNLVDQTIILKKNFPKFDFHVPLLDLPFLFKSHQENLPRKVPYLGVPRTIEQKWRQKTKDIKEFKIGLNWQGNTKNRAERFRGLPSEDLEILSTVENVVWFSLQKGSNLDQLPQLSPSFQIIDTGSEALVETAGLIQALDLIITSDTAIAHLAGSLGKPVWILLHHAPDWRWGTIGTTNLWYPSARLFRQLKPGHWKSVMEEVLINLRNTN